MLLLVQDMYSYIGVCEEGRKEVLLLVQDMYSIQECVRRVGRRCYYWFKIQEQGYTRSRQTDICSKETQLKRKLQHIKQVILG